MTDERWPSALHPGFSSSAVNEPIRILEGELAIRRDNATSAMSAPGAVWLRWLPTLHTEFEGQTEPGLEMSCTVRLPGETRELKGHLTHNEILSGRVTGRFVDPLEVGAWHAVDAVRVHLARFPSCIWSPVESHAPDGAVTGWFAGRLKLDDGGKWVGVIDRIPQSDELEKVIETEGGGYISHVGEFRYHDGGPIEREDAESLLAVLHFCLAFLAGARCGPIVAQGISDGVPCWTKWAGRVTTEATFDSWLPTHHPGDDLSALFAAFTSLYTDPASRRVITYAVGWLVEANRQALAIEVVIPIVQIALETLAWFVMVRRSHRISEHDFKRITAEGRIRLLLSEYHIPLTAPAYMPIVEGIAKKHQKDVLGLLVAVRNDLVHGAAASELLEAIEGPPMRQLSQLGTNYLELASMRHSLGRANAVQPLAARSGCRSAPATLVAPAVVGGAPDGIFSRRAATGRDTLSPPSF